MFLQKLNLIPFFLPSDTIDKTPAIEDKSLSKEDAIEFLGTEDEEEKPLELEDGKKSKEDKEDSGESDKEDEKTLEDELEEDLADVDEEKLELVTPVKRKEILAKYPTLFKEFPALEKAYYREQKYSEILPTIEDAQEASNKSQLLDSYEQELMTGRTDSILQAVKEGDPEAFNRIVDNYLPALEKVDQSAYYHVIGNVIKHTIATMVREGKEAQDPDDGERLTLAAKILNHYIFGTNDFVPPQRLSKPEVKDEKADEIEQREKEFLQSQFETYGDALQTKVTNILTSTVDKNIDPRESMTPYVKNHATKEALDNLDILIAQDVRFTKILDKLWERAINDKYSSASMDRIRQAYLSKAKTLLPSVIKKARNEALKGLGKRVESDYEERDRKGPLPVGNTRKATSSSNNSGKTDKDRAQAIPKGVKTLDFLMQD